MATSTQIDAMGDTLTMAGSPGNASASSSPDQRGTDSSTDSDTTARSTFGTSDTTSSGAVHATLESGTAAESETRGVGTARSAAPPSEPFVSARSECLSEDSILQYRQGELSREQLALIDQHLDGCDACRELIDFVIADEPEAVSSSMQMTTFQRGFVVADRYQIVRFVGRGGMGEVYSAVDRMTVRLVALKTVVCTAADDARAVRKLLDEVVNSQRVAHPNVFKIYDLHEHRDVRRGRVPFFTMEFIDGESLGARLRRERLLPASEARAIAQQLLAGLSAAHAKGVLHLDFKSDNVMLRRPNGEAVIMDFGLSRASDVQSRQRTSERLQAAGTLPYMSLEQLECRADLGPASDVYSFGVVLYEMLTGQLPFQGNTLSAVLLKQLRELPVAPSQHVPISQPLEAFLMKCLARAPRDRYPDATRALAALAAISTWHRPSPPSGRVRARRFAVVALALMAAGLLLHVATRRISPPQARESSEPTAVSSERAPGAVDTARAALRAAPDTSPKTTDASPAATDAAGSGTASGGASPAPSAPAPPKAGVRRTRPSIPHVEPSATPAPDSSTDRVPPDWHGPPPKRVPKPRPL